MSHREMENTEGY